MAQSSRGDLVVGLDIGTTKICVVVGEVHANAEVDIIGIGLSPSNGLRKGVVVNIESTVQSIKKAIDEAERMAGCQISSVYVGIAGSHIKGFNSRGQVPIRCREITQADIDRVVDAARAVNIPPDQEIIHVLPQEFIVDEQEGIQYPLGMTGVRLEADVHIVTGAVTPVRAASASHFSEWVLRRSMTASKSGSMEWPRAVGLRPRLGARRGRRKGRQGSTQGLTRGLTGRAAMATSAP